MNQNDLSEMIYPKNTNNVEYCPIKANKLFDLDQKNQIKTNINSDFLFVEIKYFRNCF